MKKFTSALLTIGFFSVFQFAQAVEVDDVSAFQKVITVPPVAIEVPTVVAVSLQEEVFSGEQFLVHEIETDSYVGHYLDVESTEQDIDWQITTQPFRPGAARMLDEDMRTFTHFSLPEKGSGSVRLSLKAEEMVSVSRVDIRLAEYVSLPNTVEVKYFDIETQAFEVALAASRMTRTTIQFPAVETTELQLTFTHSQPLRISELYIRDTNQQVQKQQALRFLAQPEMSYKVYYQADRTVSVQKAEAGDLRRDEGVFFATLVSEEANPLYSPADVDKDGVIDLMDNCVRVANVEQTDVDRNGRGDACDDFDRDGRINSSDNCVNQANRNQLDTDGDGIGDVCDSEESRFTEANPWVPWVGMGTAAIVLVILFLLVAQGTKLKETDNGKREEEREGEE